MAKFEIEYNGQRFEVEAPDEASAVAALGEMGAAPQSNEQRYTQALDAVRQSQFPDFTDQQWADYSQTALAPSNLNNVVADAQVFGFGDEMGSALGALGSQVRQWTGGGGPGFGEAFGQYQELNNARQNLGKEQMGEPAALAGEVLGGASIFGPARSAAGAVIPMFGAGAANASAAAPSTLRNALTGLGTGGAMGALYGFGATEGGLPERGAGALVGGSVGGVTGAAAPYVVNAGVGAYNGVRNALARNVAAADLGIDPAAASILREISTGDQSLGPQGAAAMNAAGNEAMFLDSGTNAQQAADYLMRRPGQSASIISEALEGRASRDAGELQNALNLYLGDPQGLATMRRNIATASAPERSAAYQAAYDAPIDYASEQGRNLQDIITNRVDQADINAANALMRAEGIGPSQQILAQVADDGTVTYQRLPNIQQIDYITRALNDRAASNAGLGALGGQTNQGRVYGGLSSDLRGAARDAVPEYAAALETAADPIRRSQATQTGYDLLNSNLPRDEAAMAIQNMTGPEREAVALGIRSRIDETLSNVSRAVTTGREDEVNQALRAMRDLTKPANRTKVALAIGDADADLLFEEVDRIFISLQREALRQTGSQTAGRQFMDSLFQPHLNPTGAWDAAMQGKPLNAGQRIIQALSGATPESYAARADQIGQDIARALVSQGPELAGNIAGIQRLNASMTDNDAISRALSARLIPLGAPVSYQSSMRSR